MSIEFIERYSTKKLFVSKYDTKTDLIRKLTHLYMNGRNIEKIGDLSILDRLNVLYMHNNNISKLDNFPSNLSTLTHLYLQWNKIRKIENLNCLINLKKLYLGNNEIARLENLEQLGHLEELHIDRQKLKENEIFTFDENCMDCISKSIKVLNVTKLNLTSLGAIENLYELEVLVASDNKFTCPNEIGVSLGFMPYLIKADFSGSPAAKDTHYRDKITAQSNHLETLDGRDISRLSQEFIKKFEKIKIQRHSKTSLMTAGSKSAITVTTTSSSKKPSRASLQVYPNLNYLNFHSDGDIGYRTWKSLQPANKVKKRPFGLLSSNQQTRESSGKGFGRINLAFSDTRLENDLVNSNPIQCFKF